MKRFGPPRRVEAGRLVYYSQRADASYWDDHWAELPPEHVYGPAERGDLGRFEKVFAKHLPKNLPVLEAGCGLGQFVVALRARGYDARGIDFAASTVAGIRRRYPDLPVEVGDATAIAAADATYGGYISLGVVEHVSGGPEPFLREAFRVLRPGGVAIITVPSFNALRRSKARVGSYRAEIPATASFYQYAFKPGEFGELVRQAGFEVLSVDGYDAYKSLVDEVPGLRRLCSRDVGRYHLGSVVQKILGRLPFLEKHLGHMLRIVAQRPASTQRDGR